MYFLRNGASTIYLLTVVVRGRAITNYYGVDRERAHNSLSITHVLAQDYELQRMRIFGAVTSQSFTEKFAYVEPLPKNAIALTWANHHRQKTGD